MSQHSSGSGSIAVGMVGHAFMGAVHSQAWRVAPRFFDLPLQPTMSVVCGRDAHRAAAAADRLGWADSETDWRRLLERDDVDLIDICTPGDSHAEIAIAALRAGKHVLCEKPMANTVEEAEAMARAADEAQGAGVRAMVGFTYRRVPAIALARKIVEDGRIGEVRHVRAQYLQDWISDPEAPLSWRLEKDKAGSGALGDIGAHIVDLTQFITQDKITEVSGQLATFVKERPSPRSTRACRARPRRSGAPSLSTTPRSSSPSSPAAPSASSRRPASPPAARTRSGSRSTAARAAWPSTSRT